MASCTCSAVQLTHDCVQTRTELRRDMKAILNEVGITSILVTHDQEEAFDIADQVAVFNRCVCAQNPLCLHGLATAGLGMPLVHVRMWADADAL